ncbi:cytochrome C [Xanthomonas fragariae]|nr:cytochrome C [Xanthomonas fragariae]
MPGSQAWANCASALNAASISTWRYSRLLAPSSAYGFFLGFVTRSYGVLAAHLINSGAFDAARYLPYGIHDTTANLILLYWMPFGKEGAHTTNANVRFSASWFRFDKFNGSTTNVFGAGNPITNPRDLDSVALSMNVSF